jgi:hypothetical protein
MVAAVVFIASLIINFPFPHESPFGEEALTILDIPIKTVNGLYSVRILTLFLLILSLYFLHRSLEKYHFRSIIAAIFISSLAPPILAEAYQKTMAEGIYAVSYQKQKSTCRFEMGTEETLDVICDLPFENYSNDDVKFEIEFYDKYLFEDDEKMLSLLNSNAPYKASIRANEEKEVRIETDIDVSEIKNHIISGDSSLISIIIKSRDGYRKL